MLQLIMILLIYGVDTEIVKCPEHCKCDETQVPDIINVMTTVNYDTANLSDSSPTRNGNLYKTLLNINETYAELIGNKGNYFPANYTQGKKCGKSSKENVRDIFIHNFSTKSVKTFQINSKANSKEIRIKRTLKLDLNHTVNTKKLTGKINEILKGSPESRNKLHDEEMEKDSENARNKEIFTYQITCSGLRDLKPLWLRYLPSPATQLNIRQTFFQSFKAFQQILKESPTKLNQLTLLSVSDNVINQKAGKKYSSMIESTNKERTSEMETEEKHSEFLPFASLQNPKLRSKSDYEFTSKGKCKNLQVLNLVNNTITYLPQDTFHPFFNLQILNLSNNLIEFIDNEMFSSLVNLVQLDIHNNRLQSLNEVIFKNLTKLLFLDVSQNLISNIAPSTFQYLISLNILNLAGNPLSENQEAMILLGTGKRLQIVDISKTGLKQIPGTLERSVRVLNLLGNHLLSIRCGDLDSYSLLSYLNLRGNKISYVEDDALGRLEFLNNLQISENNLFQIPKSLPNNLEILNLSYNNIQNITNLDFLNLSLLKELSLSYNQVSNIEGNAFNNLVHLKVLDLSRNPILILPNIYGRVKLKVLNFSYFTNIPDSYSTKYKQFPVQSPETVKHLNLESSPLLTKIFLQDTRTLGFFTSLEELDLRFTNLTTIRKDIFSLLPQLKILKVEGNPWHCGKEILILSNWLKTHESEETTEDEVNTAHCSTPSHLYKTTLITLKEEDFQDARNNKTSELVNPNITLEKENAFQNHSPIPELGKHLSDENIVKRTNNSGEANNGSVKKVNIKKYNKSSVNVKSLLTNNKTESFGGGNCCGKSKEKLQRLSLQKTSKEAYLLSNKSVTAETAPVLQTTKINSRLNDSFGEWNDTYASFRSEIKNSLQLKSTQVSLRTLEKAEAVTAKDTLSLKKEYNSHLSFLILSSVGLVVMATLTFTSLYFSRARRDQSYQRQNQDIEVCSISSLKNELW